jgi:hypothetical protein
MDLAALWSNHTAHFADRNNVTWADLSATAPNASCKRLYEAKGQRNNGTYKVNPDWAWEVNSICLMSDATWGWTYCADEWWTCTMPTWTHDVLHYNDWVFVVKKDHATTTITCTEWSFTSPAAVVWTWEKCYYK